jgi:UDP:flavonoid glycosyltransferase YjiC (YdhE family)
MNENAARVDWAGLGTRLPRRLVTPRGVKLAVRKAVESRTIAERVRSLRVPDGAARAADIVERFGTDVPRPLVERR